MKELKDLVLAAGEARTRAHAPYSGFKVGAALVTDDGELFTGCNVENATYGLTMCAERVALYKAISEGVKDFRAIAIVTAADTLTPPCGACRQLLWEFCGDIVVVTANRTQVSTYQLKDLLPHAFDSRNLR